jgi:5'-3' exoribonuclease 2
LFSDASVPGEGEHKIMNFIRLQRAQPGYDPNIKHVLYGMDADLIMLGLATHEIHFNIIRETVVFKGKQTCSICGKKGHLAMSCQGKASTEDSAEQVDSPFQFLKLSILREYLRTELLVQDTQFPWDSERAIDDFVFLCFFVGNDFLPHLPSLEIREGALDDLIILYKRLMASSKGYLTNHGVVDLQLTNVLLKELSQLETRIFRKRKKDQESYERYKSKNEATPTKQETQTGTIFSAEENQKQASLLKRRLEDADTPNAKRSHSENIHESDDTKDVPLDEPEVLVEVDPKAEEPFASDLEVVGDYASDFKSELKKELEIKSKIENVVDDVDFGTDGWKVRYYTSKFGFQDRHIFDKDPEFMK